MARWYCPQGHRTFSLLPDFLAARMPGLLTSVEDTVATAAAAKSMEAAADALRSLEVTLPSALRWLRRRVRAVHAALDALCQLEPNPPVTALMRYSGLQIDLGQGHVLLWLRRSLAPQLLHMLPAPLGFLASRHVARSHFGSQHDMGPDIEFVPRYVAATDVRSPPCDAIPPIQCLRPPFRRLRTCSASGVPIAACWTAVPTCTCYGSRGSEPIAHDTGLRSVLN